MRPNEIVLARSGGLPLAGEWVSLVEINVQARSTGRAAASGSVEQQPSRNYTCFGSTAGTGCRAERSATYDRFRISIDSDLDMTTSEILNLFVSWMVLAASTIVLRWRLMRNKNLSGAAECQSARRTIAPWLVRQPTAAVAGFGGVRRTEYAQRQRHGVVGSPPAAFCRRPTVLSLGSRSD